MSVGNSGSLSSASAEASTGVSGVRNSWLSIAKNWSFARLDRAFSSSSRFVSATRRQAIAIA